MVVQLISSPRTISTALMYSFYNRDDFDAVDEPLYARYLTRIDKDHPGKTAILKSQSLDAEAILNELSSERDKHVFIKNMASHLEGVDVDLFSSFHNVILFRDPARIISSFSKVIQKPILADLGIKFSWEIYKELSRMNKNVIAVNSDHLLDQPEQGLKIICDHLAIPMSEKMLSWPAGPKNIDGVWAKYWYANVHKSTGFMSRKLSEVQLEPPLAEILEKATPFYNNLVNHAII